MIIMNGSPKEIMAAFRQVADHLNAFAARLGPASKWQDLCEHCAHLAMCEQKTWSFAAPVECEWCGTTARCTSCCTNGKRPVRS